MSQRGWAKAHSRQENLINWQRWSRFRVWRWYMRRVWQPMKPAGRRITYIPLWISVVEFALIAMGVAIYLVEYVWYYVISRIRGGADSGVWSVGGFRPRAVLCHSGGNVRDVPELDIFLLSYVCKYN